MDLQVEVVKVELKDTNSFELRCKAETDTSGEILIENSSVDLSATATGGTAAPPQPKLTKSKTRVRIEEPHLAKFRFRFKKPSPVAALLFTAVRKSNEVGVVSSSTKARLKPTAKQTSGVAAKDINREKDDEIGQCFFPITFRPSEITNLGSLAMKADELVHKTQTGYLTKKVEGIDINRVVGRILFKVFTQKPLPKKSLLKSRSSYLDLKISKENFAPTPTKQGPSPTDLIAREKASLCEHAVMPGDSPKVNVIFHSAVSAQEENLKDLVPVACLGTSADIKEDGFFKDGTNHQETRGVSILKPVSLQCSDGSSDSNKDVLEFHLSGGGEGKTLFSSAHTLQSLYPFKHYNWEYNWRWLPGTQTDFLDNFQSNTKESKVVLSVVFVPPASDFTNHEGLEVLVQNVDLDVFAKDRNLIACVQLMSNDEMNVSLGSGTTQISPYKQQNGASATRNFNMAMMQFSATKTDAASQHEPEGTELKLVPAYFFYAINPFFRSIATRHSLQFTLYSVDQNNKMVWWKDSKIASASVHLPPGLKKILLNPENQGGVKCHLLSEDITQPEGESVLTSMTVVLRWKTKEMQFLNSAIDNYIDKLPLVKDLVFSQTETEATSLYNSEAPQHSQVFVEEYKTAITKMGLDILKLRQENEQLSKENKRLEKHMIEMEASIVVTAADQRTLQPLTKPDLIHRVVELSEHLLSERRSRKGYQDKVRSLQNQLIEKNDIVSQHVHLQQAHEAQQKLVRELQSKVEKYRKCCETSRKQESVINQLEALLALEASDRRAGNVLSIISKENADLRAMLKEYQESDPDHRRSLLGEKEETIASLRKELDKMAKHRQNLEEQLNEKSTGVKSETYLEQTTKVYELEQKLKVAEARENTLMNELEENGRRWAQEKARYEILLTQLQTKWDSLAAKEQKEPDMKSPPSLVPSRPLLSQNTPLQSSSSTRERHRESHHTSHTRNHLHSPHHRSLSNFFSNQSAASSKANSVSLDGRITF